MSWGEGLRKEKRGEDARDCDGGGGRSDEQKVVCQGTSERNPPPSPALTS